LQIIFGSIVNIHHWLSDFMLHHHRFSFVFGTVLGIFGVEFVRVMLYRQRIGHEPTARLRKAFRGPRERRKKQRLRIAAKRMSKGCRKIMKEKKRNKAC